MFANGLAYYDLDQFISRSTLLQLEYFVFYDTTEDQADFYDISCTAFKALYDAVQLVTLIIIRGFVFAFDDAKVFRGLFDIFWNQPNLRKLALVWFNCCRFRLGDTDLQELSELV